MIGFKNVEWGDGYCRVWKGRNKEGFQGNMVMLVIEKVDVNNQGDLKGVRKKFRYVKIS